jgi:hypothetical protein
MRAVLGTDLGLVDEDLHLDTVALYQLAGLAATPTGTAGRPLRHPAELSGQAR